MAGVPRPYQECPSHGESSLAMTGPHTVTVDPRTRLRHTMPRLARTRPALGPRPALLPRPAVSRRTAPPHWARIEGRGKTGVATRRDDARAGRGGTGGQGAVRAGATSWVYGLAGGFHGRAGRWGRTPPCRRGGSGGQRRTGAGVGPEAALGRVPAVAPRCPWRRLGAWEEGSEGGGIVGRWAAVRPMGRLGCSLLYYRQRGAPSPGGGDGRQLGARDGAGAGGVVSLTLPGHAALPRASPSSHAFPRATPRGFFPFVRSGNAVRARGASRRCLVVSGGLGRPRGGHRGSAPAPARPEARTCRGLEGARCWISCGCSRWLWPRRFLEGGICAGFNLGSIPKS